MANRRMISKTIFQEDKFTDLSITARLLYCYLILEADDDGFFASKKTALMFTGAKKEDLKKLVDNGYIIEFPSGVYVIRHWLQMNRVQETRKTPTIHIDELAQLQIEKDGSYSLCRQNDDNLLPQYSIGQYQGSLGEDSTVQDSTGKGSIEKVDDTDVQITSFLKDEKYKTALDYYRRKIGNFRSPDEYKQLHILLKIYDFDDVIAAIDFMATKGGKSVNYLDKVLESGNWG